ARHVDAGVRVPQLAGGRGALACRVECAAVFRAEFTEVPRLLRRAGHAGLRGLRQRSLARALIVEKEEGFVLAYGAANCAAENVPLQVREVVNERYSTLVVEEIL